MKSYKGFLKELNISDKRLNYIIKNIDKFYYVFYVEQVKKSGKVKLRTFEPSKSQLKVIQKKIANKILTKIPLLSVVQGGTKGKSNISNARLHQGKKYHLCTDISSFFPSISCHDVHNMLKRNGFTPKLATIITRLTTYRGHLPQGTPSSTMIANLVFQKVDKELLKICNANKIVYSRFVDDLVFSSQSCFKYLQNDLLNVISKHGFKRSHSKTFYKIGPTEVTGILVKQNNLAITNKTKNKLNTDLSESSRKGLELYIKRIENYK